MNLITSILLMFGQQVTLPPEIHGMPGSFVSIPATSDCKNIQWVVLDSGLNLFPVELLKDTSTAVVTTTVPGKYRVLAYSAKGDTPSKPAFTTVTIGELPEPNPPTPPEPEDLGKLGKDLKAIYKALNEAGKQEKATKLAALYKSLSKAVLGADMVTAGDVLTVAKEASSKILNPSDLAEIRSRLQSELQGSGFPEDPATNLDENLRKSMAKKFTEISVALERITK